MSNVLGLEAHSEREALANLLDALSIAENAARQMALATEVPHWIIVAGKFREARSMCVALAGRPYG
jgi:hypothetical protein